MLRYHVAELQRLDVRVREPILTSPGVPPSTRARLPVLMTTCSPRRRRFCPSSAVTSIVFGLTNCRCPLRAPRRSSGSCRDACRPIPVPSCAFAHARQTCRDSNLRIDSKLCSRDAKSDTTFALWMMFLLGRHAMFGHEPPIHFRSTTADFSPCFDSVQARYFPASPLPRRRGGRILQFSAPHGSVRRRRRSSVRYGSALCPSAGVRMRRSPWTSGRSPSPELTPFRAAKSSM